MKRIVGNLLLALCCLSASQLCAEGEFWSPLYNELARLLNQRLYAAGSTYAPNETETQAQADERFLKTNGTLSVGAPVGSGTLGSLRSTVVGLAQSSFVPEGNPYQLLLQPPDPTRPEVEWSRDDWGNVVWATPSLFTLAETEGTNAFAQIPESYGGAPVYSNSFSGGPVLWEHYDELYKTIRALKYLAPRYGSNRFKGEGSSDSPTKLCPFKASEMLETAQAVYRLHRSLFGPTREGHRDSAELLAKCNAGAFDEFAVVTADDINLLRDLLEQVATAVYASGSGSGGEAEEEGEGEEQTEEEEAQDAYDDVSGQWAQAADGSWPILFSHPEVRESHLSATEHRAAGGWSSDYYGDGTNRGGGWGGRLQDGQWMIEDHLAEIKSFADALTANGLWVEAGSPGRVDILLDEQQGTRRYGYAQMSIGEDGQCAASAGSPDSVIASAQYDIHSAWRGADYCKKIPYAQGVAGETSVVSSVYNFQAPVANEGDSGCWYFTVPSGVFRTETNSEGAEVEVCLGDKRIGRISFPEIKTPMSMVVLELTEGERNSAYSWARSTFSPADWGSDIEAACGFAETEAALQGVCTLLDYPTEPSNLEEYEAFCDSSWGFIISIDRWSGYNPTYIGDELIEEIYYKYVYTRVVGFPAFALYGEVELTSETLSGGAGGSFEYSDTGESPSSPPNDSGDDALVVSCESCSSGMCPIPGPPPDGVSLPGVQYYIGHGSTWHGPSIRAYTSRGNTSTPHAGLSLGSPEDGVLLSFSLDTQIVSDSAVTDPNTNQTSRYVNLLRPTGRIVTFRFPAGGNTGMPQGPDSGNDYVMRDGGSYLDVFFYESSGKPEEVVIHRYSKTTLQLCGVAYGPSFDEGDSQSGSYGSWAGLAWECNPRLSAVQTSRWYVEAQWSGEKLAGFTYSPLASLTTNPLVGFALAGAATASPPVMRIALSYGEGTELGTTKEVYLNGAWTEIDNLQLAGDAMGSSSTRQGRQDSWDSTYDSETKVYRRVARRTVDNQTTIVSTDDFKQFPWGREQILSCVGDADNPLPGIRPATYEYYDDLATDGAAYGHLKLETNPNGGWTRYEYDAEGRVVTEVSNYGNAPVGAANALCVVTTMDYTPLAGSGDDGSRAPNAPRTVVQTTLGVETSRSYTVILAHESRDIRAVSAGAAWDDPANLVTTTKTVSSGSFLGKVQSVTRPDGTMTIYSYATDTDTMTTTVDSGVPNAAGDAIVDGTRSVSVVDMAGTAFLSRTSDIATGAVLSSSIPNDFDDFRRPQRIDYLDGTYTTTVYGCCGPVETTDREGIVTTTAYDEFKRVSHTTRNGITTFNLYDDFDRVVGTIRKGTDDSEVPGGSSQYDDAGRLEWTEDSAGVRTTFSYSVDANGNAVETVTNADGGTRTSVTGTDGRSLSVSGTATSPVRYGYGVDAALGPWAKTIRMGDAGEETEWTASYADFLGNEYRTEYADGAIAMRYFDSLGRVWKTVDPDGVTSLVSYNDEGEAEYSCLDRDRDDVMDFAGMDTISRTINEIGTATIAGATGTVRRTLRYVWQTDNTDTATVAGTTETSLDGMTTWSESFGRVSTSTTVIDRATSTRTVTSTAPDGTSTVSTTVDGRVVSVVRKDDAGAEIARVEYGYDAHGRQHTVTTYVDGSPLVTTTDYDAYDRVVSVASPDPDGAAGPKAPLVSSYVYDDYGRRVTVVQPDGGKVHTSYWPTGAAKRVWGEQNAAGSATSLPYPTEYTYDSQGRTRTLTTWQDLAGDSNRAVTTWHYDAQRGHLAFKEYADGKGPSYTYTPAGKLETRTWARTSGGSALVTTYGYDNAGSLVLTDYSDGTADLSYTYDRLNRRISATDGTGTTAFAYNADGSPATETLPAAFYGTGTVLSRSYDTLARPTGYTLASASLPSSSTVSYGYDGAGRLQTVTADGTVWTYGYEAGSGRLEGTTMTIGGTARLTAARTYDGLGRLLSIATVASPATSAVSSHAYEYNEAGQRVRATLETGEYWDYAYDQLGQVVGGTKRASNGTAIPGYAFGYAFDDIGNRTSTTENGAVSTYTANSLNQYSQRTVPAVAQVRGRAAANAVVSVTPPGGLPQRADRLGDVFHTNVPLDNSTGPVDASLTVTAVLPAQGPNGEDIVAEQTREARVEGTPQVFAHDDDGNLLSDGRWTYAWNGENRLVAMESGTVKLEFVYDYVGRRVEKRTYAGAPGNWTLAETRRFLYDGWNLIAEFTVSGVTTALDRSHVWGLDLSQSLQGAGGVGGLLRTTLHDAVATGHYPAYDGNGNVMRYLTGDGSAQLTVSAILEYSPFGRLLQASGDAVGELSFRFATKFADAMTRLVYYGYRYYQPETGRWSSRDPIKETGGLNLYVMVGNDPMDGLDHLGLMTRFSPAELQYGHPARTYAYSPAKLVHKAYRDCPCKCVVSEPPSYDVDSVKTRRRGGDGLVKSIAVRFGAEFAPGDSMTALLPVGTLDGSSAMDLGERPNPGCCEVRQSIAFMPGDSPVLPLGPHGGWNDVFFGPGYARKPVSPEDFHEDRDEAGNRYRRWWTGSYLSTKRTIDSKDYKDFVTFRSSDIITNPLTSGGYRDFPGYVMRLSVHDICAKGSDGEAPEVPGNRHFIGINWRTGKVTDLGKDWKYKKGAEEWLK